MPRARLALREIGEISEYLSACQLGVTFASIGIGFLGEPAVADLIHPWLGGSLSHGLALAISVTIAYVLITALHITIGERVPKLFAISRAEGVARAVARPLYRFTRAFRPVVAALNGASNAILRLLRVNPSAAFEEGGTPEDLKLLIAQSLEGGQLAADEALMLSGVFELREQQARQVMTPIPRVVTVDISEDAEAASQRCIKSGHTRLLVTKDSNPDRINGIIHANALLGLVLTEGPKASIAGVVRPALIVPEPSQSTRYSRSCAAHATRSTSSWMSTDGPPALSQSRTSSKKSSERSPMRPIPPPGRFANSRTASGWYTAMSHLQIYGTTESSSSPTPRATTPPRG
jgi:CBS domain containing-hemolysin-like protein